MDQAELQRYGGPQLSRQNRKPHGKNKNLTAKPETSRQNQLLHSKNQSYSVFAVKYLVLP